MQTITDPASERIYPDAPGGMSWQADLSRPITRDPWVVIGGDATYHVADGMLQISGAAPRIYVRDPSLQRQWRNVEITVYFKRVRDSNVAWSGMAAVARTDHGSATDWRTSPCDTRGLSARLRNDGASDFAKETVHPTWATAGRKVIWRNGLPKGLWFGYKHVVYDLDDGGVRQETWLDSGDGTWRMVNWNDDVGGSWGTVPCAPGIDPAMPLRADSTRPGSESGRPNIGVYFRADGVGDRGLLYRSMSIREIRPPGELCSAYRVVIGEASHPIAGVNIRREENQLVVYNSDFGPATTTNRWGAEVVVRRNIVVEVRDQRAAQTLATPIPRDGVVLSGHGVAMEWLLANAAPGAEVTLPPGYGSPGLEQAEAALDALDTALQEATEALQEATEAASILRQAT